MIGKTINGYTLKQQLGIGGMAEVWLGENALAKKAAVKLLLSKFCNDENIVARFQNEAKVMVQLDHANIRQVYDYGNIDGRPCILMEYLEGADLKALMKSGRRFTHEELQKWWNQIADALNYTHAQGVVHRDIKPSNIFLDQKGNIKLLDFGIAKIREGISMTQTGAMMGTLMYMSPEQVDDAKHLGPESDDYSLAVTFVHLLTGKAPYDSSTMSDFKIRESIVYKPLDLSGVPAAWQEFLAPYLEKEPAKRHALIPFPTPTAPTKEKHMKKKPEETQERVLETSCGEETVVDGPPDDDASATVKRRFNWTPKKTKRWSIIASICVLIVVLWGITGIKGTVSEKSNSDLVLPGATIVATNTVFGTNYYDNADKNGRYRIGFMLPGKYLIQCRFVGFQINEQEVNVFGRKKVDFAMDDGFFVVAEPAQKATSPIGDDHAYVDLGLPSGTLWATCNMGASKPEDYGHYYAWGETSTKSTYNWNTYKYANGNFNKLTKYCSESDRGNNGFTDHLTTLQTGDDPAASWGSDWRMPSKDQWNELLENTTNKWTTQNGVEGRLFTAKNGQTLFLPGWDSEDFVAGRGGSYWSRSLYTDLPSTAWSLHFSSGGCHMGNGYRIDGFCVRPVLEK